MLHGCIERLPAENMCNFACMASHTSQSTDKMCIYNKTFPLTGMSCHGYVTANDEEDDISIFFIFSWFL